MKNAVYLAFFIFTVVGIACLEPNFPLAVFFLTLAVFCFLIARYIDNHEDESKEQPPRPASPPPRPSRQEPPKELQFLLYSRMIERFNTFYDLGLFDGDIYEISRSPSPWETLEEYVTPGTPSIEESIDSLIRTAHTLAHGIGLDENTAEDLESTMLSFIDEIFETGDYEEILALYTLSEDNCTPETHYLIGKINYFAIILSLIDFYADKNDNDFLKRKCEEIAEKNQSIF